MRLLSGLKKIYSDSLIRASALMFLSSVIMNILNLIFWLYVVRKLSPVDYGTLNSLFSLWMIFGLPAGATYVVTTKFIAQFHSQNDYPKIRFFLYHLGRRIFMLGGILFFLFILFSSRIALFMNISSVSLVIASGILLFFSILTPIPAGILNGLQLFLAGAIIGIASGLIKLILCVGLVALNFGVMGVMVGLVLSTVMSLVLLILRVPKGLLVSHSIPAEQKILKFESIYSYFIPVSIGIFCTMVLTNIDVILVKHYFSPLEAGYYSVAQMIGKIVLFLPAAITAVMFPKLTNSYSQNEDTINILKKSLLIVGILCSTAAIISIIFPYFILKVLTGKVILQCIPLARLFALAMTFFALAQILGTYHLSTHNFKFIYIMAFFTALQTVLIILFHRKLTDILYILLFISTLLFVTGLKLVKVKVNNYEKPKG